MAIPNILGSDTIDTLRTAFNSLATNVGDLSTLDAALAAEISPDNLVNAVNYLYTIATDETTNFSGAVAFGNTIDVTGNAEFQANLNIDGTLTFDNGGVAISSILDEDNMASNSATALATQQSIKAYVDTAVSSVNAAQLEGLTSSQFLRSDASDIFNTGINLDFGGSVNGAVRITHVTADNSTYFRPYETSAFNTAKDFGFSSTLGYWFFDDELRVNGLFTSRGIDDNATANRLQIENAEITLKTASTIQGNVTTTGNIIGPSTLSISNGANEEVLFGADTLSLRINSTTRLQATTSGVAVTGTFSVSSNTTLSGTLAVTGSATVGGGTVWHSANDGAGSGLDADLLDGNDSSYYRNAGNINAGTLAVARGGTGLASYTTGNYIRASASTTLEQRTPAQVLSDIGALASSSYTASDVLSKLLTVDGAASLLDADLLDGQHGSFYTNASNISSGTLNDARLPATMSSKSFSGNISVTGSITATSDVTAFSSDDRLKTRITYNLLDLDPLDTLMQIEPIAFKWNETMKSKVDQNVNMNKAMVGLSAQNLEKIFPIALGTPIDTGDEKYLTVKYESLIPLLVAAIKQLSLKVKELETKNG